MWVFVMWLLMSDFSPWLLIFGIVTEKWSEIPLGRCVAWAQLGTSTWFNTKVHWNTALLFIWWHFWHHIQNSNLLLTTYFYLERSTQCNWNTDIARADKWCWRGEGVTPLWISLGFRVLLSSSLMSIITPLWTPITRTLLIISVSSTAVRYQTFFVVVLAPKWPKK